MSHVIGQYLGSRERFQVVTGGSEVTIQFQSDPDDSSFILSQGFLIHYRGEYRQFIDLDNTQLKDGWGLRSVNLSFSFLCRGRAQWHLPIAPSDWVWLDQFVPHLSRERQRDNLSVPTRIWHQWLWHHHLPVGPVLEQHSTHLRQRWGLNFIDLYTA